MRSGSIDADQNVNRQICILLDQISEKLPEHITFIGFIDNKAELLEYRKVNKAYQVPAERQESLNIQITLVTSLVRNWKDVFGLCKHMTYSSEDCDVVFIEVLGLTLLIMVTPGTGPQVAKQAIETISKMTA